MGPSKLAQIGAASCVTGRQGPSALLAVFMCLVAHCRFRGQENGVAALKHAPQHDATALQANSRGEHRTQSGFSTVRRRFKLWLEAKGLDERRIADLLGQKSLTMARHSSRWFNLAARSRETATTLEPETARWAQVVKPHAKSAKPKPNGASD